MTRFVHVLILLLLLISCGKNSSSSGPATSSSLLPMNPSDKPIPDAPQENTILGLDDKLITMNFDAATQKVTGHSAIRFKLKHSGRPYFEIKGTVKNIKIDGTASSVTSITDPDGQAQSYLSLQQTVFDKSR